MAPRQHIEWNPEEVAAGYDLSSIYEEVVDNSTAPVISSVVNTTDLVDHPAVNITAVVKEVARQVVERVANTISSTHNSTTLASTTVAPSSNPTPSTVSTIVKRVVEHLGKKPSDPVATVCTSYFCETSYRVYYGILLYNWCRILQNCPLYISPYIIYFCRPAAFLPPSPSCWRWRSWGSGWG